MCTTLQDHLSRTMNEVNEVTVFLTEPDAERFKQFKDNYETFMLLVDSGVFGIRNGSAVLNFDSAGHVTTIQRADMLYNVRVARKVINS